MIDIAVRNQVLLERLKEGEHLLFAPFLRRIERALRLRLSDEGDTIFTKKRLAKLLADTSLLQKDIYDDYAKQLTLNLGEIGIQQAEFEVASYGAAIASVETTLPGASFSRD